VSKTFHDLVGATETRAEAALAARGFGDGDVLAIQMPNGPAWIDAALAAMRLGGAVTGVSALATHEEVRRQLADSGAALLMTPEGLTRGPDPRPLPGVALLPYSSGTSGLPKGVMLTHENLVAAVGEVLHGIRLTPDDTVLALAPFGHVMGFVITLAGALAAGARLVPVPRFEPRSFLELLTRERVTVVIVPPPVMPLLARSPIDLPAAELIVCGGAPLSAALQQAVAARFPHAAVGQGYGLTETTAVGAIPDRTLGTVPGSCGRAMPGTELRVVGGEIQIRGPVVMAGYLNAPEATAAMIDADGWLHTGDLGRVDEDGNVFVVDRIKELIKVNALQVAPAELEALLLAHPAVAECAVVPRTDERCGEVPVAVVVARADVSAEELMAFVAGRVAPHKRLRAVRFVDAIPRTPAGKILRRLLRDQPSYV
jgi:acyl-CoA synthetase (AMP-forming)/AMP-acid ligase II